LQLKCTAGINDTAGGNLTAGMNKIDGHVFSEIYIKSGDTGGKFATRVNNAGGREPPV
jgi:hypothetical protein